MTHLSILDGGDLMPLTSLPSSLSDILASKIETSPSNGMVYLQTDKTEVRQSYADLQQKAERILNGLRQLGVKKEDLVLLQLENPQDFIPAFWACVFGGIVPVLLPTPAVYELSNSNTARLISTWGYLNHPIILTNSLRASALKQLSTQLGLDNFPIIKIEELRNHSPDFCKSAGEGDDIALQILTSGSTGTPKLVTLSHRNILYSIFASIYVNGYSQNDISLNWLPLYHIGGLMRSLREISLRCLQIQAPYSLILQNPLNWLDFIDFYRVTLSWAPNFFYGLIASEISQSKQQPNWNFRTVKSLYTSGEVISAKTMISFWEKLAPYGLNADALHTSWGMTEACSASFSHTYFKELQKEDCRLPSVGKPVPGVSMRIVDETDTIVANGSVGHLQLRGDMVTKGYYNNSQLNHTSFTPDGWLRTGDLGIIQNGCLTITGRLSDKIIVNGVNYSNYDIEAVVEDVKGVEPSFTAAIAVPSKDGLTEELAIFFNTGRSENSQLEALIHEIRLCVVRRQGITPRYVIPLAQGNIPKTSVGKIQRVHLRQKYITGEFDNFRSWPYDLQAKAPNQNSREISQPNSATEDYLSKIFAEVLNVTFVEPEDNFFALGGGSLQVIRLVTLVAERFSQQTITIVDLFLYPSVRSLAAYLCQGKQLIGAIEEGKEKGEKRAAQRTGREQRRNRRINAGILQN